LIKIKAHYQSSSDIFILFLPITTTYATLMQRLEEKRPVTTTSSIGKVRYQDEDGDYITIGSDEDVEVAVRLAMVDGRRRVLNVYVQ
jgi:cell division control protein 24